MQYANVIVDKKLSNLTALTYSIPSELLADIKIGQLCEVPIGNNKYLGVIKSFTRNKPQNASKPILKLRSLAPIVSSYHLDYYRKIAISSLSTLNDVLFYFLPGKIARIDNGINPLQAKVSGNGLVKTVSGTTRERFDRYISIIEKYQSSKSLLFIFPDYTKLNSFARLLNDKSIPFVPFHGQMTMKNRWNSWSLIHNTQSIVLATRLGLGLIPFGSSIIIVDDPGHPGFSEDQRPRFSVSEILKIRKLFGDNIILGSSFLFPTLARGLSLKVKYQIPNIALIQARIISFVEISNSIKQFDRVLISAPKKGEWGLLICKNCSTFVRCAKCQSTLCQMDTQKYYCYKCNSTVTEVKPCSDCNQNDFSGFGIGLETIKQNLQKITNKKIVIVDKNNIPSPALLNSNQIIVVATTQILDLPIDKFDIAVLINYDGLLNIPIYNQEEKIFSTVVSLCRLAKQSRVYFKNTKNQFYSYIIEGRYLDYIGKIISDRYPDYPPFKRILDLTLNEADLGVIKKDFRDLQIIERANERLKIRLSVDPKDWNSIYRLVQDQILSIEAHPDPVK